MCCSLQCVREQPRVDLMLRTHQLAESDGALTTCSAAACGCLTIKACCSCIPEGTTAADGERSKGAHPWHCI